MLEWRLKAYRHWLTIDGSRIGRTFKHPPIDYQDAYYYAAPKKKPLQSLDEVDPELLKTYEKLGIPLARAGNPGGREPRVAVDAVFDSVSVATTYKKKLEEQGIIFCPISEAVQKHPELVKKYLGSVVPVTDNFFATLNSAVFTDGSFVYIPKGVRCPMELSTYFRINAENTGQFERTLIIADEGSYVSYLEGCTAPKRDENQLHAAVVELVALDDAQIKYSTVQNWYPGDENGKGGIYNFVTKRGACRGKRSKISWTQVETGSAITWKYPSCVLQGDDSRRRILFRRHHQQSPAGRYRHKDDPYRQKHALDDYLQGHQRGQGAKHLSRPGENSAHRQGRAQSHAMRQPADRRQMRRAYRALYRIAASPRRASSMKRRPRKSAKISCSIAMQRGLSQEEAMALIVNGFCKEVLAELPMEFAVEAQKLVGD